MLMKANHPRAAYGDVCLLLRVVEILAQCFLLLLFFFYLSLASPLELIRDLKRLSLRVNTYADAVYVFNMQSAVVQSQF